MNHEQRRALALWRYSVLGPLVSARLEYGDRREHFRSAARRIYERPCCSGSRFAVEFVSGYFRDLRGGAREVWS